MPDGKSGLHLHDRLLGEDGGCDSDGSPLSLLIPGAARHNTQMGCRGYDKLLGEDGCCDSDDSPLSLLIPKAKRIFLEVFSGDGPLTDAVRKEHVRCGPGVDIIRGQDFDLTAPCTQWVIPYSIYGPTYIP
jgi:hypothetical protein